MNNIIYKLIEEAKKCLVTDDVPISAIIIKNNKIIAKAHNMREKTKKITDHAEILAINKACKKLNTWHLNDCEMYVTMQPCLMCLNVISQARIKKIYYILENKKYENIQKNKNSKIDFEIINTNNDEYIKIIKNFFKEKRK